MHLGGYVAIEQNSQRIACIRARLLLWMFLLMGGRRAFYAFYAIVADARISAVLFTGVILAAGFRAASALRFVLRQFRQLDLSKLPNQGIDNYRKRVYDGTTCRAYIRRASA